jgi:flagellar biosynthesis protein FlhF
MRIKSYFADSVQEAIEKARLELGPDAMLMHSKKTEFELRPLGAYEVVFGVPGVRQIEKTEPQSKATALAGGEELIKELTDLRHQIETVRRSVTRQQRGVSQIGIRNSAAIDEVCAKVVATGFSEELAQEIAEAVELRLDAGRNSGIRPFRETDSLSSEAIDAALRAELETRLKLCPELGVAEQKPRVVLFAGPPGAGKTTALIKLAVRHGLRARVPLQILSLDTLRVGGWEQLAAYARITGLPFAAVHNPTALGQVLNEYRTKELILIDTPGLAPADWEEVPDIVRSTAREAAIEVQLVLSACLQTAVARRTLERFAAFHPSKLLFTRLDEAESTGTIVELAMRSGLPVSYLSDGQRIPEDIQGASAARLLCAFSEPRLHVASAA